MSMRRHFRLSLLLGIAFAACMGTGGQADDWVDRLTSEDEQTRASAVDEALGRGAAAITPLGELAASAEPATSLRALRAMERIVHSVSGPAAPDERRAVSDAICRLLWIDAPLTVKAAEIQLIGYVGDDEAVAALVTLLNHPKLGEDVRQALQRIDTASASAALARGLRESPARLKPGYILALAQRGDRACLTEILPLAADRDLEVRIAALTAIGALGDAGASSGLVGGLGAPDTRVRAAAADALLRLAGRQATTGNAVVARRIFERVLRSSTNTGRRLAAVAALGEADDSDALPAVLSALGDPDPIFHAAAMALVDRWAEGDAVGVMKRAVGSAGPEARAGLMLGLASRDDGTVAPTLMAGLQDGAPIVQAAAARGLGSIAHQPAADTLLRLAEDGAPPARAAALNSTIVLLAERIEAGETPELLRSVNQALELAEGDVERNMALKLLVGFGDPSSLPLVDPLTTRRETRAAALEAYVAIGKTISTTDADRAINIFNTAVGRGAHRPLVEECVRQLRALGVDFNPARAAGFITEWSFAGPFPARQGNGFGFVYPPEKTDAATGPVPFEDKVYRWELRSTNDVEGMWNLQSMFSPSADVVVYASAEVSVDEAQDVVLKIGSDDGVKVWVNGELVHANDASRPVVVDEDTAAARLKAGTNRILVKVRQGGGGWGMVVRVVDADGNAVKLQPVAP